MSDRKSGLGTGLEALQEEIAEAEQELNGLKGAANLLARRLGLAIPYELASTSKTTSRATTVRPDQFANYSAPSTAARAFLEWRGRERGAATADEIHDSLISGGFSFEQSHNSRNALRIALGKDAQIRRLPNGAYGMSAWYPNAIKEKEKPGRKGTAQPASTNLLSGTPVKHTVIVEEDDDEPEDHPEPDDDSDWGDEEPDDDDDQ